MAKKQTAFHTDDLQRIKGFRLMDDAFMTAFFRDDVKDVELLLRIILEMPETYVIFITENDVIGLDAPIYPIERYIFVNDKYISMGDGAHIIYVNGAKQNSETALGRLMHDFSCVVADDMYYPQLAARMRYFKENKEGVEAMSKIIEDVRIEIALNLIAMNKLSLEEIAESANLPLERVKELAAKKSA